MRVAAKRTTFYGEYVGKLIFEKYASPEEAATKSFLLLETYEIFMGIEAELYKVSPYVLFDMWENEKVTGEFGNLQYIRGG